MIDWQKETLKGIQLKSKYHFSEDCLERLIDSMLIERYVVFVLYFYCIPTVFQVYFHCL